MITETTGNLLRDDAQALVNTVNTVGVMGKGLALQFKRAHPDVFARYADACRRGEVQPGHIHTAPLADGRIILNFPTKRHWRDNSRMEDIDAGLDDLLRLIRTLELKSVAIPPLGCGNGGLPWPQVRRLILDKLAALDDVDVRLYGPGTPAPDDMPVADNAPELTPSRARFLEALNRYLDVALATGLTENRRVSLIEAQKVAYLLQVAGASLGLKFVRHIYGPYAHQLNRALSEMEGHQTHGYGDGTGGARADLRVAPDAVAEARNTVGHDIEFEQAWAKLARTINGYTYPDGMELLASVHYLASVEEVRPDDLFEALASWSPRKKKLFRCEDALAAHARLVEAGLVV